MPRAALNTREVQDTQDNRTGPQENRTGPRQNTSGFQPAQRTTMPGPRTSIPPQRVSMPPQREFFRDREQGDEEQDDNITQPTTKSGFPDRRFKGQRDLPPPIPEEVIGSRARTGGTIGDVHVTIDGKPDRRFKENRSLSDEEVMAQWADAIQEKFGRKRQR